MTSHPVYFLDSAQIADLLAELADERSTSESLSQLLETETLDKLHLEKDLKDLQANHETHSKNITLEMFCCGVFFNGLIRGFQVKFDAAKEQLRSQEMELMEARLMKTSELNGDIEDNDDGM